MPILCYRPLAVESVPSRERRAPREAHEAPIALQGVTPAALVARLPGSTIEEARRIVSAVHRERDPFVARSGVRRQTHAELVARAIVPSLDLRALQASALDPFVKLALATADGHVIEAVRIPLEREGRFSVCVSSQAGCALACAFCATGRLGLRRNLEVWEIVEQVRAVRRTLAQVPGGRVHGVVFQGMGEPLANLDRVLDAIAVLSEPSGGAIDARNITVCTSGLPTGIRRLAREAPRVRLGWSLGSPIADVRRRLMPIEAVHPTEEVFAACVEHARLTGLAPMWAVTLLEGVNDDDRSARALAAMVHRFAEQAGRRPRVSVIPYNAISEVDDPFRRSAAEREERFRAVMHELGAFTHKRYSGGGDVAAACGQLAGAASRADGEAAADAR